MVSVNIVWAYPDFLNLHGDRGNVMALERVAQLMGIEVNLHRVNDLDADLALDSTDLVVLNAGQWRDLPTVAQALRESGIASYVTAGGSIFASGTSWAILGQKLIGEDGSPLPATGLADFETTLEYPIYGDDLIVDTRTDLQFIGGQRLVGSQIALTYARVPAEQALGRAHYGRANGTVPNSRVGLGSTAVAGSEDGIALGCTVRDTTGAVIGTNLLGPVLAKNPWFTRGLLELVLHKRQKLVPATPRDGSGLEAYEEQMRQSAEVITEFNATKASLPVSH